MAAIPWSKLSSIVVFRTDHIGDLIVSTPFLRALKRAAPQAHIKVVVAPPARDVLTGNPNVDEVQTLRDYTPGLAPDLAIGLSPRSATYKLVKATGARYRAAYYYPERVLMRLTWRLWLTHAYPMEVRGKLDAGLAVPHEIEQQAQFACFLGLTLDDLAPELHVSQEDTEWGRQEAQGRIGLHLSPNWFANGWTMTDLLEMAKSLPPYLVTYGPAEAELAGQLGANVLSYGNLTIQRWAALLGGCRSVVSTDTGAVHIAASQGVPVVVVYKPEIYELCRQQWHPWGVPYKAMPAGSATETGARVALSLRELGI